MAAHAKLFTRLSKRAARFTGSATCFAVAVGIVVAWALTGPLFGFGETWQLVINTGTTIITFLMVFVLQNAQTRDARAVQAKLNEIILTSHAENRFIGIEHLDDEDLQHLDRLVAKAAKGVRNQRSSKASNGQNGGGEASASARLKKTKRKTAPVKAPSR